MITTRARDDEPDLPLGVHRSDADYALLDKEGQSLLRRPRAARGRSC